MKTVWTTSRIRTTRSAPVIQHTGMRGKQQGNKPTHLHPEDCRWHEAETGGPRSSQETAVSLRLQRHCATPFLCLITPALGPARFQNRQWSSYRRRIRALLLTGTRPASMGPGVSLRRMKAHHAARLRVRKGCAPKRALLTWLRPQG